MECYSQSCSSIQDMIKFLADWLFKKFCHPDYYKDIKGDLEEIYGTLTGKYKAPIVHCIYLKEVFLLFRWSLLRTPPIIGLFNSTRVMYRSYLLIAWRGLIKDRVYGFLNISGLSLGICVFLMSYLFVSDELEYDYFHTKKDRIVRLTSSEKVNDNVRYRNGSAYPVVKVIKNDFPTIEEAARLSHHHDYLGLPLFEINDVSILVDKFSWTDPAIFKIFTFNFLEGNPETCLNDLRSLVITDKMAAKLFGNSPALGRELTMHFDRDNDTNDLSEPYSMKITGVIESMPSNSHLDFEVLANMKFSNFENWSKNNWYSVSFPTYLLLRDQESVENLQSQMPDFVDKYFDPKLKERLTVYLQPLLEIRLSSLPGDLEVNSNRKDIWVILVIAIIVLALACINFMNLSTARYTRRAKEVGLRKVIGARKGQIFAQFLMESILITYLSIVVAIVLCYLLLPFFNDLLEKNLLLELWNPYFLGIILLLGAVVGFISGLYPSLYLSSFRPAKVLKGFSIQNRRNGIVRKGLVIFQFAVTMTLLIAIGTIYYQMSYLRNLDLDIDKEQYVFLRSKEDVYSNHEVFDRFKRTLSQHNSISESSGTWSLPFGVNAPVFFYPFLPEGFNDNERFHMHLFRADEDFLKTFGLELIAGRDFSREFPNDPTGSFILNNTALNKLGWTAEEAVGKDLEVFSGGGNSFKKGKVIGVIKDFNFLSLHTSVSPLAISMVNDERYRYIAIKINPTNLAETTEYIEEIWKTFAPLWPPELFFMEEEWKKNYESEERLADTIKYLTLVGLIIACLGLFGLASFTSEQKEKEISIRKVLGASVGGILKLISREFTWLVIVAFFIAAPVGWYYSKQWLAQFAYRIEINWWLFALVAGVSFLITFLTISYHSIKAAIANPVETLRSE